GVLGGSSHPPDNLEEELSWIDAHTNGRPYGIDIIIPENIERDVRDAEPEQMSMLITREQREFTRDLLAKYGVEFDPATIDNPEGRRGMRVDPDYNERLLDVAFRHPIRLIANALGLAPPMMIDRAKAAGVPVGALVGSKLHAIRQANAGVDFIVAQGTEA